MVDRDCIALCILMPLLGAALGGCSMLEFLPNWSAEGIAGPAPSYRTIVAPQVRAIVGNIEPARMRISDARRVDSFKGASWLVCLEVGTAPLPRYYAVFIQRERIVESRLSVVIDQCEQQPYAAFDWAAETAGASPEAGVAGVRRAP
jgi:hypothetical protein